ncbi:ParB N-terminal domain-containing protein [Segnochrobactrum spirostomi]|uniref:Uncharacterized protein n=1 Tax=Segnochrobactrum spirostomi TaxID=2608987 RepID=A0A6A7YA31_9HYPH|nr:ParB N-terminal domain-containing protein [Segnochrobactrum spirostomi]MQT14512.1 hypothetical protein [Segnochrobactrum spirostomi]
MLALIEAGPQVRSSDSVPVLIAGRHRIEAPKLNGAERVECLVFKVDDVRAELIEISENLHRAEE